jgi:hypothetical protein
MGHVTSPSQGIFSSQERRGKSLGTRLMSTLPFQGGVIFRTFVPDSGFRTYAMMTAMVILP